MSELSSTVDGRERGRTLVITGSSGRLGAPGKDNHFSPNHTLEPGSVEAFSPLPSRTSDVSKSSFGSDSWISRRFSMRSNRLASPREHPITREHSMDGQLNHRMSARSKAASSQLSSLTSWSGFMDSLLHPSKDRATVEAGHRAPATIFAPARPPRPPPHLCPDPVTESFEVEKRQFISRERRIQISRSFAKDESKVRSYGKDVLRRLKFNKNTQHKSHATEKYRPPNWSGAATKDFVKSHDLFSIQENALKGLNQTNNKHKSRLLPSNHTQAMLPKVYEPKVSMAYNTVSTVPESSLARPSCSAIAEQSGHMADLDAGPSARNHSQLDRNTTAHARDSTANLTRMEVSPAASEVEEVSRFSWESLGSSIYSLGDYETEDDEDLDEGEVVNERRRGRYLYPYHPTEQEARSTRCNRILASNSVNTTHMGFERFPSASKADITDPYRHWSDAVDPDTEAAGDTYLHYGHHFPDRPRTILQRPSSESLLPPPLQMRTTYRQQEMEISPLSERCWSEIDMQDSRDQSKDATRGRRTPSTMLGEADQSISSSTSTASPGDPDYGAHPNTVLQNPVMISPEGAEDDALLPSPVAETCSNVERVPGPRAAPDLLTFIAALRERKSRLEG